MSGKMVKRFFSKNGTQKRLHDTVDFVSGFRLKLMYISLIVSIRPSLIYLHCFQMLVLLPKKLLFLFVPTE